MTSAPLGPEALFGGSARASGLASPRSPLKGRVGPHRAIVATLAGLVLGLNLALLSMSGGVRLGRGSSGYLGGAEQLMRGKIPGGHHTAYLGYEALVALCLGSGLGPAGVVVLQVV